MHDFFSNAGAMVGNILRTIIDFFHTLFTSLGGAINGFMDGLSRSLGIRHSFVHTGVFIIGALLVIQGIRNLLKRRIVSGIIWLLIGFSILSWTIG